MKLSKKLEAEIKQVMKTYWDSYLKGDLKTWASFLPDGYRNIGTTEEEIWNSKKDIVNYTMKFYDQIVGMAEMRDKKTQIILMDPHIMVHELGDIYIKMEKGWAFYSKFRLSSLLKKTGTGWKILHQHGSYPDSKTADGQTFAFDKINKENIELRDAVKRRTVELEEKNRELEIDTALEKVRSVTMAMRKPEDLAGIGETIFFELKSLDFKDLRNTEIIINNDIKETIISYYYSDYGVTGIIDVDYKTNDIVKSWADQLRKADDAFAEIIILENEMSTWRKYREEVGYLPDPKLNEAKEVYYYSYSIGMGGLSISTFKPVGDEQIKILERFRNVFNLSYQRYTDIEKAEAQARDAQIELALERVRARTMAMQKSEELAETVSVLFMQLLGLGVQSSQLRTCGIVTFKENKPEGEIWITDITGEIIEESFIAPFDEAPAYKTIYSNWKKNEKFLELNLKGNALLEHLSFVKKYSAVPNIKLEQIKKDYSEIFFHVMFFSQGYLFIVSYVRLTGYHEIFKRFQFVFQQSYTRFLDLKKAEAQSREAMIEAALERTRTQSMIMQHSNELDDTLRVFHEQVLLLGIDSAFSFLWLPDEEKEKHIFWAIWEEGKVGSTVYKNKAINYPLDRNEPATKQCLIDWESNEPIHSYAVSPEGVENYFEAWAALFEGAEKLKPEHFTGGLFYVEAFMKYGCFGVMVENDLTNDERKILGRLAIEFERTYTRFLDLQKAEAQVRESQIEAALERVRARALAMQQPEELKAVAEVLRHEMGLLGVEELETSSIYLHDEHSQKAECWYALKDLHHDEKMLVTDHFPLDLNDTWVGREMFQFYESPGMLTSIVMKGAERKEWINYCEKLSVPLRGYYGDVVPDRTYHLYKFSHGYIGAASAGDISVESWGLLKRAASVFSLAYSRFRDLSQARTDLKQLKEEKKRAEDALTELKATQTQLIQSEKMASLGELTAGIAHEIQNPLNFVNNFSDVNAELLDELLGEAEKGNFQEVKDLVTDIRENEQKINHHGKRADAIVKGMLQHSRASNDQKEMTDINALADEYLRLAYHGLRAKDKSFNATLKTAFDPSIGKIQVIPQDIGRVLLNLYNNAFYAVHERNKLGEANYEPTVEVITELKDEKIQILVKDNGTGISEKLKEKIFQPFFTTKPTGQGTGLGLSLSYDIVKAHGGNLKLQTKDDEGTTFLIQLAI